MLLGSGREHEEMQIPDEIQTGNPLAVRQQCSQLVPLYLTYWIFKLGMDVVKAHVVLSKKRGQQ